LAPNSRRSRSPPRESASPSVALMTVAVEVGGGSRPRASASGRALTSSAASRGDVWESVIRRSLQSGNPERLAAAIDLAEDGGASEEVLTDARRELARLADAGLAAAVASSSAATTAARAGLSGIGGGDDDDVASTALKDAVRRADEAGGSSAELLLEAQTELCRLAEARLVAALAAARQAQPQPPSRAAEGTDEDEAPASRSLRNAMTSVATLTVAGGGAVPGGRRRTQLLGEARAQLRRLAGEDKGVLLAIGKVDGALQNVNAKADGYGSKFTNLRAVHLIVDDAIKSDYIFAPPAAVIGRPTSFVESDALEQGLAPGLAAAVALGQPTRNISHLSPGRAATAYKGASFPPSPSDRRNGAAKAGAGGECVVM